MYTVGDVGLPMTITREVTSEFASPFVSIVHNHTFKLPQPEEQLHNDITTDQTQWRSNELQRNTTNDTQNAQQHDSLALSQQAR